MWGAGGGDGTASQWREERSKGEFLALQIGAMTELVVRLEATSKQACMPLNCVLLAPCCLQDTV